MKLNVEQRIEMDKFKPRFYQREFITKIENDGIKKAIVVWPRRCISSDSHILMANGSIREICDLKIGDKILSFNGKEVVKDIVEDVWCTGEKEVLDLKAGFYPKVTTTKDHEFYSATNRKNSIPRFKTVDELKSSSLVFQYGGYAGKVSEPDRAELLGYLTHDGYVVGYQQPKFTNTNIEILKRVEYLALKVFNYKAIWREKGNGFDLGFSNGTKGGGTFKNKIKEVFRDANMDIPKSRKRILPEVFDYDEESIIRYLAGVISSDGSIYTQKNKRIVTERNGKRNHMPVTTEISIHCGLSKDLATDTYWLLRKIGIIPQYPKLEKTSNWKLRITGGRQIEKLLSNVIIYGKQEKQAESLSAAKELSSSKKLENGLFGCYYPRLSNERTTETFDIRTRNNHNFFANGYLVHNSGKDICAWNIIIRAAIREVGSYIYCLPSFSHCRRVILSSRLEGKEGGSFMDFIPKELISSFNQQEMRINLINGSVIIMVGSDNAEDRVVGMAAKGIVISEAALANPVSVSYLMPLIASSNGFMILISTPRGHNRFWELYNTAKRSKDWYTSKLTVEDTRHIPIERIEADIRSGIMSRELSRQEYWTSFSSQNQGSYFGKYVDKMILNDQFTIVPYEPSLQTLCAMDLGMNDMFTLIFAQIAGPVVRIIDCYENHSEGLEHYANIIKRKDYGIVKIIAPHDIKVRELNTGISRLEKLRSLGFEVVVAPLLPINDGIEAIRTMLPRTFIDNKKCDKLIKAIENYTKEYDEVNQVYKNKPNHNRYSHFCDGLRYLSTMIKKLGPGTSPEELDARYNRVVYGGRNGNMPDLFR